MNDSKILSPNKIMVDRKKDLHTDAGVRRLEIKPLLIPIFMLLLCLVPYKGGGFISPLKFATGALGVLLSLPAVVAAFLNKIKVKVQLLLLVFLTMTLLNVIVGLAYNVNFSWWIKLSFGSYIFVAMIFTVSYYAKTPNQRHYIWMWLVVILTLTSFVDYVFAISTTGLGEAWEERSIGSSPWSVVAVMMLLPSFGNKLFKSPWLSVGFFSNAILMILSSSRINFMILGMGLLCFIIFVARGFGSRLFFIIFLAVMGFIVIVSPIYERMYYRFSIASEDSSVINRLDQAISAALNVTGSFSTLLLGKGYGVTWKSYPGVFFKDLAGGHGFNRMTPGTINRDSPHNDYAARLLYCGLTGLILQLLLFFTLGYVYLSAIRRFGRGDIDRYTQIRIHGALLVLLYMTAFGLTGGNFYYWTNNIFQGCVLGLGLADASEILAHTKNSSVTMVQ
jgi:hypothetical protein